jgi:hypothetical protein
LEESLFNPIEDESKINPLFLSICKRENAESARWMLDDIFKDFNDPDGNFLQQFKTDGFNARFFELYLFAYFSRSGFQIERPKGKDGSDFIIERNNLKVGIEATTTNSSVDEKFIKYEKNISELTLDELKEYLSEEMPRRFRNVLKNKLEKRYWTRPRMKDIPFVIGVETFHDDLSLRMTDSALIKYVYGMDQTAKFSHSGKLEIKTHEGGFKVIGTNNTMSGFFSLPEAKNISAVLFTNTGTFPKFARMGYQHGIANNSLHIRRTGVAYFNEEEAMDPMFFAYTMDNPPQVETWGEGCTIIHNPNCLHPVPQGFFPDATDVYRKEDEIISYSYGWQPFCSNTSITHLGELGKNVSSILSLKGQRFKIAPITKEQFRSITGVVENRKLYNEYGWFADETFSFLGVIVHDKCDEDWGFAILARDKQFVFHCIEPFSGYKIRSEAVEALQNEMVKLLQTPKKIYW